jgi:ubiquitin-protein ligase
MKQVRPGVFELGLVSAEHLTPSQRQVARAAALKRLMRDLQELQRSPLPTVSAAPLEEDLFEWHGNLLATSESNLCGLVYHIIMKVSI